MRVMTSNTWFQNSKLHPFSLDLFDFHPCHALLHPESLDLGGGFNFLSFPRFMLKSKSCIGHWSLVIGRAMEIVVLSTNPGDLVHCSVEVMLDNFDSKLLVC